jgi:hypothetical protein
MMAAEVTARDVELIRLNEKIERLAAIIDLYIRPNEFLFDQNNTVCGEARRVVARRVERDREAIDSVEDIKADLLDINGKLDVLMHKRRPGEIQDKRLKRTDGLLVARGNVPIPFSEMKLLQGFKQKHNRQDMTKLGHVYAQFPDKYDVRDSKLGGKTIKLNPAYFKHLTNGGV